MSQVGNSQEQEPPCATVDRAAFGKALDRAVIAAEKKPSHPILGNVHVFGNGHALTILANDLDLEIRSSILASANSDLNLTAPAHSVRNILKKAPSCDFIKLVQPDFSDETPTVSIKMDSVDFAVKSISPNEFPTMAGPGDDAVTVKMRAVDLLDVFCSVQFAISKEETRYYLNGVNLHEHENGLRFVATDGHRLARRFVATEIKGASNVILPVAFVTAVIKILKEKSGPECISLTWDTSRVQVAAGEVTITSKLIDGSFPDYERACPQYPELNISMDRDELLGAVKAVTSIFSAQCQKALKLTYNDGKLVLEGTSHENGHAKTTIEATANFDGPFAIGVNASYLVEQIIEASPDGGEIALYLTDGGGPFAIIGNRENWYSVLMPMRT
jgi:DNA polymerase III subunit beta